MDTPRTSRDPLSVSTFNFHFPVLRLTCLRVSGPTPVKTDIVKSKAKATRTKAKPAPKQEQDVFEASDSSPQGRHPAVVAAAPKYEPYPTPSDRRPRTNRISAYKGTAVILHDLLSSSWLITASPLKDPPKRPQSEPSRFPPSLAFRILWARGSRLWNSRSCASTATAAMAAMR